MIHRSTADNRVLKQWKVMKTGLLLLFLSLAVPVFASEIETVLIVSIDALHPAALREKTSPTLDRLMRSGRYTLEGQSVTLSQTLIAHTAMMTGLTPAGRTFFCGNRKCCEIDNLPPNQDVMPNSDGIIWFLDDIVQSIDDIKCRRKSVKSFMSPF